MSLANLIGSAARGAQRMGENALIDVQPPPIVTSRGYRTPLDPRETRALTALVGRWT
jgi:hypothetical protein